MTTKAELQYQITELKMDYINLQGDVEKMESLGHSDSVEKAVIRLENMEKRLAELNKQLLELELQR
jgi:ribosomal protein L29